MCLTSNKKRLPSATILYFLVFAFMAPALFAADGNGRSVVTFTTGDDTGLYFKTGTKLANLTDPASNSVMEQLGVQRLHVVTSNGSEENLDNLLGGGSQLAIIQSDFLFGEKKKITGSKETGRQLFAIASLFPEYTQVLVHKSSDIEKLIHLVDKNIYIGKKRSGTARNALNVLKAAGVEESDFNPVSEEEYTSDDDALKAVCRGGLDASFRVTSTIYPRLKIYRDCLKLVGLDPHTRKAILEINDFYGLTNVAVGEDVYSLLFTRAVLTASEDLDELYRPEAIEELTRVIVEQLPAEFQKDLKNQNATLFQGGKVISGLPIEFHPAAKRYYQSKGYLKSGRLKWTITIVLLWITIAAIKIQLGSRTPGEELIYAQKPASFCFLFEVTAGLVMWLGWLVVDGMRRLWKSARNLSLFRSPVTIAIYALLVFLWLAMLLILHFENTHSLVRDIPNQFENIDVSDFSLWMLQILSLGESPEGLFPNSFAAKAITIAVPLIGVIGAVLAVLIATFHEKGRRERRARGLEIPALKDHIVVCGWNEHGIRVVDEITQVVPGDHPQHIAVLAESDSEKPLQQRGLTSDTVHYLRGISSDLDNLKEVNVDSAAGFLVLAGAKKVAQRNFRSVFTVKMISRQIQDIQEDRRPKIVVDMVFEDNLPLFVDAGATRVLNSREVGKLFLAYSSFNLGFSNVITSLMSLSTRPVISRKNFQTDPKLLKTLAGRNFSEAWKDVFAKGMNLLAIHPGKGEASPVMGIHPDLRDFVIFGENEHRIAAGDAIIVVENQSLHKATVQSTSYADVLSDSESGISDETPIVVIDRRDEAGENLLSLLSKKCKHLFCICTDDRASESGEWTVVPWDGEVDSIADGFEHHILPELKGKQLDGKIKVLIPSLKDPAKSASVDAVHQDDETMALVLKLQTLDSDKFHFIAEILCLQNLVLFKENGIQQPIPVHEFISLALTKLTLFGGEVTGLLIRLMENFFTGVLEDKSLQKISLAETGIPEKVRGKNFEEAARALMQEGIQLIAVISQAEQAKETKLIVLPHRSDADYKLSIQPGDALFVIA